MQRIFSAILVFSVCHLLICEQLSAQFEWLNPKPSGYANNKVVFINHKTGFILNSNGDLYRTNNLGEDWQLQKNFSGCTCMNVSDSTGVIAGYSGTLYVSGDNGTSWEKINTGINNDFRNISIVSRDTFFLLGTYPYTYSTIYKTTNRGRTFSALPCDIPVAAMFFVNSQIGYVGGSLSTILKTTDGGLTWTQKRKTNNNSILSIQFLDKDTGYAFQEFSTLLRTNDGGDNWIESDAHEIMPAMHFINTQDGYFGGQDGAMYATHDGGQTFNWAGFDGLRYGNDIYSVYFLSKDTGFAVGLLGRIIKTTNSCATWKPYSPTYFPITSVFFPTADTGFASSWNNIYKTVDKGKSWQELSLTTGVDYDDYSWFEKSHFINADTGFVTTSLPVQIHHTYDGGITWDTANITQDYALDMDFINTYTGFITLNTVIIKTEDGGRTWKNVWTAQYNNESFQHISYVNNDTGYAIRQNVLYKTTDGSKTWTPVYTSQYTLTNVAFTSSTKGIITDDYSTLFSTNDGGETWNTITLDMYISGGINSLEFCNPQIGYLTAGNNFGPTPYGYIYKTIDSGATWQLQENLGGNSIIFTPDDFVVIAGYGGAILRHKIDEVVLPLQFINFKINLLGNGTLLSWQTTSEINTNHFLVERSLDVINFTPIATINANENNNYIYSYSYTDTGVYNLNKQKIFYRIKSVDANNAVTYSNTKSVNLPERKLSITFTPNPANSQTTISIGHPIDKGEIFVINQQGKIVFYETINSNSTNYQLKTNNLVSGVYSIQLKIEDEIYNGQLIVVK